MRPAHRLLAGLVLLLALFLKVFWPWREMADVERLHLENSRQLVASLGLTDLALFTEARYTRHPSQADLHAAFQDHPAALERFPSGTLVSPHSLPFAHHAPLAGKTTTSD